MPANLTIDTTPASAVFLYSPRSCDNLKPPLSPTSSLKGCFVRSRPTSTDFDYEYSQLPSFAMEPTSSSEESNVTTPTSSATSTGDLLECASQATEKWALAQMQGNDSDTRSLAPSTLTCTDPRPVVPVRIIRRSDAEMDVEMVKMVKKKNQMKSQNAVGGDKATINARRRTWPSYKAIRKTVSNILHRKDTPVVAATGAKGGLPTPEPPAERVKSSSASMFTKRRRATVSNGGEKKEGNEHGTSSSRGKMSAVGFQYGAQLRRSRSFSGFTNVLAVIDDTGDDDDLDELTTEARGVVLDIRRRWDFEEVPEDAALMFERCIE
jgi:hypothetical protein